MRDKIKGFELLKFLAAFQVMYGHLVTHYKLEQWEINGVPVFAKILSPFMGVPVFFALSGYFIWKSLSRKKVTAAAYGYRRFIRIYPELWVVVAITAISILVLYYRNLSLVPFSAWIITQSTFMQFWTPSCLRGYGVGCPNGSLWTILVFVQFYIVVFILYPVLHNSKKIIWGGVLTVSAVLNVVPRLFSNAVPEILYKLYKQTLFPYLTIFMLAAFLAEYEDEFRKIFHSKWLCVALYVLLAIGLPFDVKGAGYSLITAALITVFAITFGNIVNCPFRITDISYEVYLVHMPIANVFIELFEKQNWITFFYTIVLVYLLAYVLHTVNTMAIQVLEKNK